MSTIIEEISSLSLPKNTIERAIELYQDVEGKPLKCGDSDVVNDYWIETHTLGCREAADRPEEDWMDEHYDIFDEYMNDGMSQVVGSPEDGIFITITPQKKGLNNMTKRITTLKDYSDWTLSVWYSPKYAPNNNDTTNISVMALGLAGEVSEVIAECLNINVCESDTQHELGDVIYYWTRICNTFDIDISELYERSSMAASRNPEKQLTTLLLQLSKNTFAMRNLINHCLKISFVT